MTLTDQLRSVARMEYVLVRTCVTSVDRRLLMPLDGRADGLDAVLARVREAFQGVDDRLSGSQQRPPVPARPEPAARVPAPGPAAEQGSAVLEADEVEQVEDLAEEYLAAEADHLSGELADNDELRRVQAELRAKHVLQERDEQR